MPTKYTMLAHTVSKSVAMTNWTYGKIIQHNPKILCKCRERNTLDTITSHGYPCQSQQETKLLNN